MEIDQVAVQDVFALLQGHFHDLVPSGLPPVQLARGDSGCEKSGIGRRQDLKLAVPDRVSVKIKDTQIEGGFQGIHSVGHHADLDFVIYFPGRYRYRSKRFFHKVVHGFPPLVVIHARPGRYRPAIVDLPIERTHVMGFGAAVGFDGHFDPFGLKHLPHIEHALKLGRHLVMGFHVASDAQIADPAALMSGHDFRLDVPVFRQRIGFHGAELRERLEPIFAHEAADVFVKVVERMFAVPDAPVMDIPALGVVTCEFAMLQKGRGRPVKQARVVGVDHCGKHLVEHVFVSLPDVFALLFRVLLFPAPAFELVEIGPGHIDLVVAAPKRNTGVVAQAFDVVDGLGLHILKELGIARVHGAGEHEILPDQDAALVAQLIKIILFVEAAAPYPEHVHVGVGG